MIKAVGDVGQQLVAQVANGQKRRGAPGDVGILVFEQVDDIVEQLIGQWPALEHPEGGGDGERARMPQ